MSKPILDDMFAFSGRRNRQSFILFQLVSIAVVLLAVGILTVLSLAAPSVATILWLVGAVGFIAVVVANWAAASQRIRDFGQSGVWALVILLPYVGILFSLALWFIPSDPSDNKYGPSPI
jgi:uncharacterized membrane protein YhaH (DUF805 family)